MREWYQEPEIILFFIGVIIFILLSTYIDCIANKSKKLMFECPSLLFDKIHSKPTAKEMSSISPSENIQLRRTKNRKQSHSSNSPI